jgi:hypothetical protein
MFIGEPCGPYIPFVDPEPYMLSVSLLLKIRIVAREAVDACMNGRLQETSCATPYKFLPDFAQFPLYSTHKWLVTKHLMKFPVSIFLERGEDVKRQLRCLL